ncbi:hypothetical protein RvY_03420-1 [Ramazzottius varieornatus]|uniref:Uncharacterized protein n=1 Tax=Ramazzottius varieornatus TaxID=947166 RepID=A0A1D1UNT2_RAMVA|nr:hypothetical protein RvY_03420-1 [Ramazzottius varieornatus]
MGNSPSLLTSCGPLPVESQKVHDSKKSKRYGGFKKRRASGKGSRARSDDGQLDQQENIVPVQPPVHHNRNAHNQRVSFLNQQSRPPLHYFDPSDERSDMSSDCECEESDGSSKQSLEPLQLISPRKAPNPAKENRDLRELQRELKFNNKMGINVLGQKSELSKAMEKMKEQMYKKQLEEEKVRNRSDLERELEKRARRLKEYEHALAEEGGLRYPPLNDEFHRIHAKVNGRFASVPT